MAPSTPSTTAYSRNAQNTTRKFNQELRRQQVCLFLLRYVRADGKLERGALTRAAIALGVGSSTMTRYWRRYRKAIVSPEHHELNVQRAKGSGIKRRFAVPQVHAMVKAVPFRYRQNIRSLSAKTGIPRTTLHRYLQIGLLQKSRSTIKPILTAVNKAQRISYCNSFVGPYGCFNDMLDCIDIDEKWWYITQQSLSWIVVPGEITPDRKCKHKSHITKVMALAASARPRQHPETGEW